METLEVKLGGRSYPLTLSPEEVDIVRQSAEAVEAQIAQLKSQYAITDRIDLMAMAALQIAVQSRSGGTSSPPPSAQGTCRRPAPTHPRSPGRLERFGHKAP